MSESTPCVSVLTPAYNAELYIGAAIESILKQTYEDFEFILIDDGSTDNTWNIIQSYAAKDARIVALQNNKNLGISGTRNRLIALSKGAYVVWQDADDISLPYRIAHQYDFMEKNPKVGICGGYLHFFGVKGLDTFRKYAPDDATLRKNIFRYSPVSQPAAIIRKECFEKTGLFPGLSPVAEDLAMSFQIGTHYQFANLQEVLIDYRVVETGATYGKLRLMELYTLFLREKYSDAAAYRFRHSDRIYNLLQFASVYLFAPATKIKLFNYFRNSNIV